MEMRMVLGILNIKRVMELQEREKEKAGNRAESPSSVCKSIIIHYVQSKENFRCFVLTPFPFSFLLHLK